MFIGSEKQAVRRGEPQFDASCEKASHVEGVIEGGRG